MRIAYFDCFAGASGDMILGALVDAGLGVEALKEQLALLQLPGWELGIEEVQKAGLRATKLTVRTDSSLRLAHRAEIDEKIMQSGLSERVKTLSTRIFGRLFEAEGHVHGTTPEQTHLHELGDLDTIIDIVGAAIAIESLGIDAIYSSSLPAGHGTVQTQHGLLPLPGPAVTELMRGAPMRRVDIEAELVTPTGAAILTTLARGYEQHPTMTITATGYGAGSRELPFANVVRVLLGETIGGVSDERLHDIEVTDGVVAEQVAVLETQIDDMPAEWYGHVMTSLLQAGALDVYFTPVQMKKNRPGTLLTVLCGQHDASTLTLLLLTETTTLGVRRYDTQRLSLHRAVKTVETVFGPIEVKVATLPGGKVRAAPEYESCLRAAMAHHVPLWEVYQAALQTGSLLSPIDE
jgi:uncharacterized protein (TIGR00299 family) protein